MVVIFEKDVIVEEVNVVMKVVVNDLYGYIEDLIVLFDIVGILYGLLFDVI